MRTDESSQQQVGVANDLRHPLVKAFVYLDEILAAAIARVQALCDSPEKDPFLGLHIGIEDIKRLLGREPGKPTLSASLDAVLIEAKQDNRFAWLIDTYSLTEFQAAVLLIALAPEFDLRYQRLFAYLQDDVTQKKPSVDLVLNLLSPDPETKAARRVEFSADGQLVKHRLLQLEGDSQAPLLARTLRLDAQITRFLLGEPGLDSRLQTFCTLQSPTVSFETVTALCDDTKLALCRLVSDAKEAQHPLRLYFHGKRGSGKRLDAKSLAAHLGQDLLCMDFTLSIQSPLPFGEILEVLLREAWFQDGLLYLHGVDTLWNGNRISDWFLLLDRLTQYPGVVVLAGEKLWTADGNRALGVLPIPFPLPDYALQRACWRRELDAAEISVPEAELDTLAERFRLTLSQTAEAVARATTLTRWREAQNPAEAATLKTGIPELFAAARAQCGHELAQLARRIEPRYSWSDIVLPSEALDQLKEICARVAHHKRVLSDWGFARKLSLGKGVNALFAGPSGTGKTMAAEIIAYELGLDLYKINLSGVVSKYIGETEKNLDRVFAAAENANAILLFDEADALFGKRSEVRDSHDRYANLEISYLLQKMEEYEGLAILATNLRQNLDEAFVRRLAFAIHFPFPEQSSRLGIWAAIWPQEAPLADDVDLDFLSRQFKLSGGNIKNIALASAFLAAHDGEVVTMAHMLHATRREYQKMGKTLTETELNGQRIVPFEGRRA